MMRDAGGSGPEFVPLAVAAQRFSYSTKKIRRTIEERKVRTIGKGAGKRVHMADLLRALEEEGQEEQAGQDIERRMVELAGKKRGRA